MSAFLCTFCIPRGDLSSQTDHGLLRNISRVIGVTRVILPDRMISSKIVLCERLRAVTDGEQAIVNAALSWAP